MRSPAVLTPVLAVCVVALPASASAQSSVPEETRATTGITTGPSIAVAPVTTALVAVTLTSTGVPVDVAFVPASHQIPRAADLQLLCRTPCTASLPAGSYRLVARSEVGGMSRAVHLHGGSQHLAITPARPSTGGIATVVFGGSMFAGGVALMLAPFFASAFPFSTPVDPAPYLGLGGAMALGGVIATVAGIVMLRGVTGRVQEGGPAEGAMHASFGAALVPIAGGAMASLGLAL